MKSTSETQAKNIHLKEQGKDTRDSRVAGDIFTTFSKTLLAAALPLLDSACHWLCCLPSHSSSPAAQAPTGQRKYICANRHCEIPRQHGHHKGLPLERSKAGSTVQCILHAWDERGTARSQCLNPGWCANPRGIKVPG